MKIGSWYYLTCCTSVIFFPHFNKLLNKSNCFRNVEFHAVQLIIILFYLTVLTDKALHYLKFITLLIKLDRMIYFAGFSHFLHIS